jgi:GGDEF domain-containing protein
VLLLISSIILYIVARANYLLFHALVEGFAIIVAALIYVLGTRTYQHSRNNMFLFLGIANNEKLQGLGVSIGAASLQLGQPLDIDNLLKTADKGMYAVKQSKKSSVSSDSATVFAP